MTSGVNPSSLNTQYRLEYCLYQLLPSQPVFRKWPVNNNQLINNFSVHSVTTFQYI